MMTPERWAAVGFGLAAVAIVLVVIGVVVDSVLLQGVALVLIFGFLAAMLAAAAVFLWNG